MAKKYVSYRLADDTIVDVDENFQEKWKYYDDNALFVAILSALFPLLVPVFKDTMYAASLDGSGRVAFVSSCLAVSMVHDRYGKYPHEMFDDFFAHALWDNTFHIYESNRTPYVSCEYLDNYAIREFTVSESAVRKIGYLFSRIELVEEEIPEDEEDSDLDVVDVSLHPDDFVPTTVVKNIDKPPCEQCPLCSTIRIVTETGITHGVGFDKIPQHHRCKRTRFRSNARSFGAFAWAFEHEKTCIKRFGDSFLPLDAVPPDRRLTIASRIRKGRIPCTFLQR